MRNVFSYMARNGRLPRIGDAVAPWKYHGWLLPYVQSSEVMIRGRWAYWAEAASTGRLPGCAIPRVEFGAPDPQVFRDLDRWTRMVGYSPWSDFRDLLDWLLWGLKLTDQEPRLDDAASERLYRGVNLVPMLQSPYDYFGAWISEHKAKGWNPSGFYPTPHPVCECMTRMLFHEGRDPRLLRVCEPCVGTGRMLLHASNYSLRLYGQDIDPVALAACKVNGALYAPWLSYPLRLKEFEAEDWFDHASAPEPAPVFNTPVMFA